MDALRRLILPLILLLIVSAVQAQDELTLLSPISGSLASGEEQQWRFSASDGAMLSFRLQATGGDLDPVLTISTSSGEVLYRNDDNDYPQNDDALLEGVTMTHTGSYIATVSGFGTSSGDYELLMLPGFADLSQQIDFESANNWRSSTDNLTMLTGNNRMALMLSGTEASAIAAYSGANDDPDQYIRVEVPELEGANGWRVGLAARYQDADNYYLYSVDNKGMWRFLVHTTDGERILHEWSTHPAIVPGQFPFSLGLLTNGSGFEFFYNDQLIGSATNDSLPGPGEVGLMAGTAPVVGSELTAQFENLSITIPDPDAGLPQQIQSGASSVVIPAIQRRRLVPSGGQIGLLVPESFVTFNRPGVNTLLLGGADQTFRNFALGTTLSWETSAPNLPAGCGLLLRAADENDYLLAYVDQTGASGLSARQADQFAPGIFSEDAAVDGASHRLLIIANDDRLLYYVDGQLAGTLDDPAAVGRVGNAVVNFETVTTSCQFTETWVWAWN